MHVVVKNESVFLGSEKYLYWQKESMLAIADLHLGRATAMQSKGIPLPYGSDGEDLKRLSNILSKHNPKLVILLGDIFHSKIALDNETILNLKETLKAVDKTIAIIGNHDLGILKKFPQVAEFFDYSENYNLGVFGFCHDYTEDLDPNYFWWSGHLHPRVSLTLGPDHLKAPAFIIKKNNGILPAFSSLAMGMDVKKEPAYSRYICAGNKVLNLDLL